MKFVSMEPKPKASITFADLKANDLFIWKDEEFLNNPDPRMKLKSGINSFVNLRDGYVYDLRGATLKSGVIKLDGELRHWKI